MNEHQPAGVTEQHLVEELATIFWVQTSNITG
jgi:hypothetical protein